MGSALVLEGTVPLHLEDRAVAGGPHRHLVGLVGSQRTIVGDTLELDIALDGADVEVLHSFEYAVAAAPSAVAVHTRCIPFDRSILAGEGGHDGADILLGRDDRSIRLFYRTPQRLQARFASVIDYNTDLGAVAHDEVGLLVGAVVAGVFWTHEVGRLHCHPMADRRRDEEGVES